MMVLVLSACPTGLRGDLTKWLYEISAGVFVGEASARVREQLWERVLGSSGSGRAIMIWSANTEQGWRSETKAHHWNPVDVDGLTLMHRPSAPSEHGVAEMRGGWSRTGGAYRGRRVQARRAQNAPTEGE